MVTHWSLGARWPEHISDSLSRIAGEGWGEGIAQHQLIRWFALLQPIYSLYRSTPSKQVNGVHGYRLKIGVLYRTEPLRTEKLPHRPSTKRPPNVRQTSINPLRFNRHSLFHSGSRMFLAGYSAIRSKNSTQRGKFAASSRCANSQGLPSAQQRRFCAVFREMEKTNIPLIDPLCRPYFGST